MPYVKPKVAREILGIGDQTLRIWAKQGRIKSILCNGRRIYDVASFTASTIKEEGKYIYCRVSSNKQKDDLERQVSYLSAKYPGHTVFKEIASGINFKRKVLRKILDDVVEGKVQEIVVAHRDRLCRIAWEHFSWLCEKFGTTIVVDGNDNHVTPEVELAEDLLSIVHVFSSRHYGQRRKYTAGRTKEDDGTDENETSEDESEKVGTRTENRKSV